MELDELKNIWDTAHDATNTQQILNTKMIEKMTQTRFKSRLQKVVFHELIGALMCIAAVAYMAFNFDKLTTPFFQGLGIVTALLLMVLPIVSLMLIWQINSLGNVSQPIAETIKQFATQKLRFIRFQQLSVVAAYILIVFVFLLMPKFTGGRSLNDNKYFWAFAVAFGYIFLYFFSRMVIKYYGNALQQAEELLRELEG
ncbi:hypothetical protein [Emticicia soli]|uniref:DUF3278 domain-containing protein n=1 Tax=Emticicia soli TaxID=2027878 RepID=A0ABW5JDF2_9BACT